MCIVCRRRKFLYFACLCVCNVIARGIYDYHSCFFRIMGVVLISCGLLLFGVVSAEWKSFSDVVSWIFFCLSLDCFLLNSFWECWRHQSNNNAIVVVGDDTIVVTREKEEKNRNQWNIPSWQYCCFEKMHRYTCLVLGRVFTLKNEVGTCFPLR